MDYRKKYLNRTGFKSGSGILASAPWYRGTTGPSQILKAPRGYTGMQEILAGGILGTGASKFLEDEDKENLPVETVETKLPKKEPPEDPDILPELAKQTAEEVIRKETKEKEIEDKRIAEGLEELEEVYSQEGFKKANEEHPELSPANNKKIVEADKHFGAHSLARIYGHNSNETQLIYLSPQEYLDLTKGFGRTDGTWSQAGKATIKYLENKIKEGKEIGEIPALFVGKEGENYLVKGQEGRHRAQAFKNQGYDKIPVRIEGSGRDKKNDVENKVYTATPKSYLYKEDWTQEYLNFIPKNIISKTNYNKDTKEYEDWELKSVKAKDFYDVASKEKLFVKGESVMETKMDPILEEKFRQELAMKNSVIGNKIQLHQIYNNYFIKWYGKLYVGETKDEVLNQIPTIKELKKILNIKENKKIIKKAHGGLIDKPLTGNSRYI